MHVGAIPFLNALPLIHGLPWPIATASPAVLQSRLLAGEFDLALCSITTALCHEGLWIVPACGIGCRGSVDSVRLVFRDGIRDIRDCRRIALDPESNTANLLLQVLLADRYDRPPGSVEFVSTQVSDCSRTPGHDAHLIIGDRALLTESADAGIDLGAVWTDWTGLPFVFAAWLTRTPTIGADIADCLTRIRDRNLAHLDTLAVQCAPPPLHNRLGYLRERIRYDVGPKEIEGIARFHARLIALGCAPTRPLPIATVIA